MRYDQAIANHLAEVRRREENTRRIAEDLQQALRNVEELRQMRVATQASVAPPGASDAAHSSSALWRAIPQRTATASQGPAPARRPLSTEGSPAAAGATAARATQGSASA